MKPNHWRQWTDRWTDRLTRGGGDRVEDQKANQDTNPGDNPSLAQDSDQALVTFLREHRAQPPDPGAALEANLWAAIAAEPQPVHRSSWFRSRWQVVLTGSVLVLGLGSLGLAWLMGSRSPTLQWANQNRPNLVAVANPPGDRQLRPVVRPGIQPALESIGLSTQTELAALGAIGPRTSPLTLNQLRLAELEHFFEAAWLGSLGIKTSAIRTSAKSAAHTANPSQPTDPSSDPVVANTTTGTEAINDFFDWFNNLDEATDARRPVDSQAVTSQAITSQAVTSQASTSQALGQRLTPQLFQTALVLPLV